MTDWNAVLQQAIAAAETALGGSWQTVGNSAARSIGLLVQTAADIAASAADLDADEQKVLLDNQRRAMQNVLLEYQSIAIADAEKAVDAAWAIIGPALLAALHAA